MLSGYLLIVQKKIFRRKLFLTTSPPPTPPSPKKFRSLYHFRGPKIFRTYQNFSRQYKFSRYHKITQFLIKLTEFVPFFFIISQYCPILFFICRQIASLADNLFSGGVSHPPHPPIRDGPALRECNGIKRIDRFHSRDRWPQWGGETIRNI